MDRGRAWGGHGTRPGPPGETARCASATVEGGAGPVDQRLYGFVGGVAERLLVGAGGDGVADLDGGHRLPRPAHALHVVDEALVEVGRVPTPVSDAHRHDLRASPVRSGERTLAEGAHLVACVG